MSEQQQPAPRTLEVIEKEYSQLCLKAGQAQYQVEVLKREVKNINDRILQINIEASKRKELDKAPVPTEVI